MARGYAVTEFDEPMHMLVDTCGIDLREEAGGDLIASISLEGIDRFDLAFRILGDERGDMPKHPAFRRWMNEFTERVNYYDDETVEAMVHAGLAALAARAGNLNA